MLKELWEKMRGHEKQWIETEATVRVVCQFDEVGEYETWKAAEISFRYTGRSGELHYGSVNVTDSSSLFDLKENDTFPVRYNAAQPDECEPTDLA
jgi:hypothetical protein